MKLRSFLRFTRTQRRTEQPTAPAAIQVSDTAPTTAPVSPSRRFLDLPCEIFLEFPVSVRLARFESSDALLRRLHRIMRRICGPSALLALSTSVF